MNSFASTIFKPPRERFKEPIKENPDQPKRPQIPARLGSRLSIRLLIRCFPWRISIAREPLRRHAVSEGMA
jgi:hypothetical protein